MRILLVGVILILIAGCTTTPPPGVEYLDAATAEESKRYDRFKGGVEETSPGSGEYEILVSVMNTRSKSTSFTLVVEDENGSRTIWKSERITEHVDPLGEPTEAEASAATRMVAIKVKGLTPSIIVDGQEFEITVKVDHSALWLVLLHNNGANAAHMDMH
ncbi:MAG: hypothetical protein K8I27_06425 [Planctomycetes bacterium]|nr:hypothetical protein [Planctomycetota bacterium]